MKMNKQKARDAIRCLVDNGIEEEEACVILQALGYILADEEWEDYIWEE